MIGKNESFKNAIKQYLDKRAEEDALFAASYAKQNKNIDECCDYIIGEASKRGSAVCMTNEEVYGLAVHYYDEDDIEITPVSRDGVSVAKRPQVELTEEEKAAAKERAEKAYEAKCIQQMEDAKKASAKKAAEKRKEAEKNLLSLFD